MPTVTTQTALFRAIGCFLVAGLLMAASASAQVALHVQNGQVTIQNAGFAPQALARVSSKTGGDAWFVEDNVGNQYVTADSSASPGSGGGTTDRPIIIVGGYENQPPPSGGGGTTTDPIIIVGGYESVLDRLRDRFGLAVQQDTTLGATLLTLARASDVDPFFQALVSDSLHGLPLYRYFRLLEVASHGAFGEPTYDLAKTANAPLPFPNDPLYWEQWGLRKSRIALAQWHPALVQRRVRIAVIDSGVGAAERASANLDGVEITHVDVAPTTGRPVPHGLGLLSLMADRSHDGSGVIGMVGNWGADGCYANPPLFQQTTPQLVSYNVGDFGPVSVYVARAIRLAVEAGVDVINLSLRLGYSPLVEAALQEALDANVIVVAAAGNYTTGAAHRPAAFPANLPGVISVGAADESLQYASFSANDGVDILAPGARVVVGGPGEIWYYGSGTSYAAPFVTATVAMMRAVVPDLTPAQAIATLQARARDKDRSDVGFLNALSSVNAMISEDDRVRYLTLPHECALEAWLGKDGAPQWTEVDDYDHTQDDDLFAHQQQAPEVPAITSLGAPQPNPASTRATFRLSLAEAQPVRVAVYNTLGQQVRVLVDEVLPAGHHPVAFDAASLSSGLYLVRLETASGAQTQPITLVR